MPQRIEVVAEAGEIEYEPPGEVGKISRVGARFSITLCVAGWYRLTLSADNKQLPLPQGCFPLLVNPQRSDATMSVIEDPLAAGELVPAGDLFSMLAVVRDKLGNVCARGGHEVRAHLRSPAILADPFCTVQAIPYASGYLPSRGMVLCDRRDGSYEFNCTPSCLGSHELTLTLYNGPDTAVLGGRSVQFNVVPGFPSPPHCIVKGHGSRVAWANVPAEFVLEARDAAGHLVRDRALPLRIVIIPSSRPQQIDVQGSGDGRYTVRYKLPISGLYKIDVLVGQNGSTLPQHRRHVPGSPFEVAVHSGDKHDSGFSVSTADSQADGPPRRSSSVRERPRSASPSPRGQRISETFTPPLAGAFVPTARMQAVSPAPAPRRASPARTGAAEPHVDVLVADHRDHVRQPLHPFNQSFATAP